MLALKNKYGKIVEYLDLNEEEPFALEPFSLLIEQHSSVQKSFIIARVQASGSSKSFFYDAYALNKIIFRRFGSANEYLFRLCVMNPLTNTDIEGDIEYYLVSSEILKSNLKKSPSIKKSTTTTSLKYLLSPSMNDFNLKIAEISGPHLQSIRIDEKGDTSVAIKASMDSLTSTEPSRFKLRAKSKRSFQEGLRDEVNNTQTHDLDAWYIGSDDDYLRSFDLRDIFVKNAVNGTDVDLFELPIDVLIQEGIIADGIPSYLVTEESLAGLLVSAVGDSELPQPASNSCTDSIHGENFLHMDALNKSIDSLDEGKNVHVWCCVPFILTLVILAAKFAFRSTASIIVIYSLLVLSLTIFVVITLMMVKQSTQRPERKQEIA